MSFPYELLPVLVFIVGALLSFSMGTAWGTFAILIPIINMICVNQHEILVIALGATLAGSVFGDHCSPISDTTILFEFPPPIVTVRLKYVGVLATRPE